MEESEELTLSHKTWKRCVDPIEKDGFREGFDQGRQKTFQEGFDIGFKDGFKYGFLKGVQCGKNRLNNVLYKEEFENIGKSCYICSETEDNLSNTPFDEIKERQADLLN